MLNKELFIEEKEILQLQEGKILVKVA